MDGSFSLILQRIDAELCRIQCLCNDSVIAEKTGTCFIKSIMEEVTYAANTVVEYCNKNGINSADIEGLKKSGVKGEKGLVN